MKIKGQSKFLSISALLPIFLICLFTSIILRSIQVYSLIDADTGFYSQSSPVTVIFYTLVFGSCFVFFLYSFISQQSLQISVFGVKSKLLSIVTCLFAIVTVFDTVKVFLTSLSSVASIDSYDVSEFKVMMSNGTIPMLVQSIFGLVSIIYFFCLASSFGKGDSKAGNRKIMALAPVGWVAFRMIYLFVSKISFIRVSDLFLELIMLACMALFFMAFAQVASGVYSEATMWKLSAYGLSAAVIAGCLQVSRLIFSIIDKTKYINENHTFNIMDLVFCVFAAVLVFTMCNQTKPNPVLESEDCIKPDIE